MWKCFSFQQNSSPENISRQSGFIFNEKLESRILSDECPLRGRPRCTGAAHRYRTADGTCNNQEKPWLGAAMLPMQRFLHPVYEDGMKKTPNFSKFSNFVPD